MAGTTWLAELFTCACMSMASQCQAWMTRTRCWISPYVITFGHHTLTALWMALHCCNMMCVCAFTALIRLVTALITSPAHKAHWSCFLFICHSLKVEGWVGLGLHWSVELVHRFPQDGLPTNSCDIGHESCCELKIIAQIQRPMEYSWLVEFVLWVPTVNTCSVCHHTSLEWSMHIHINYCAFTKLHDTRAAWSACRGLTSSLYVVYYVLQCLVSTESFFFLSFRNSLT